MSKETELKKWQELKPCWSCGHKMYVGKHMYCDGKYIVRCGSDGKDCLWFPSSGAINKADIPAYITAWNIREESDCPCCGKPNDSMHLCDKGYCKLILATEAKLTAAKKQVEELESKVRACENTATGDSQMAIEDEARIKKLEGALEKIRVHADKYCSITHDREFRQIITEGLEG